MTHRLTVLTALMESRAHVCVQLWAFALCHLCYNTAVRERLEIEIRTSGSRQGGQPLARVLQVEQRRKQEGASASLHPHLVSL